MTITDEHVAVLRAQLTGQRDLHLRLAKQLDPEEANSAYAALIAGAFLEATERRFKRDEESADSEEIINFVARMRTKAESISDAIDPELAESMILYVLGKGTIVDAETDIKIGHQIVITSTLVGEEQFSADELEAFLAEARSLGNEFLK